MTLKILNVLEFDQSQFKKADRQTDGHTNVGNAVDMYNCAML